MRVVRVGICGWGNVATGMFKAIAENKGSTSIVTSFPSAGNYLEKNTQTFPRSTNCCNYAKTK